MDSTRERELVDRARKGDEDAYRQLVETHMRRIYGLAVRFTGRHEEADEVAQETFIRAFRSLDRFHGTASFGTWIYRIAINCCLSQRRRDKRSAIGAAGVELDEQLADERSPSQEQLAMEGQTRALVARAMERLSGQQRAIFVMKHLQQKTIAEIAEVLGCAEGTVKQQLFRAVQKVREHLAPALGREVASR